MRNVPPRWILHGVVPFLLLLLAGGAHSADAPALLTRINAVGEGGAGNAEAKTAWKELVQLGTPALLPTLKAFDDSKPRSLNWLYAAVDAITENTLKAGKPLPSAELEAFILDTKQSPRARRLAYEKLTQVDSKTPERLLPGMLQDPSVELRRDAVARVLDQARALLERKKNDEAANLFRKALTGARDPDQVNEIAKAMKMLGTEVDLIQHFGFIPQWYLATPFENHGGVGYKAVYPPEKGVDLKARYKGKGDAEVRWVPHTSKNPLGKIDLNTALGKLKGTVAYAYTVIDSPKEQQVEVRVGSINAVKVFLNGKLILAREEYHHGSAMDQYVGLAILKPGKNEILVKVCQNEQQESWAQDWHFQLRLSDKVGGAIPFTVVSTGTDTGARKEDSK